MASLKQTIANRLNALNSTGPKTAEGKARSRRNATTHGLSRLGLVPPSHLADAIADRIEQWQDASRPDGPAQRWVFERLCAESVRLDACERRGLLARADRADRAAESWDDDRAALVAELASGLRSRPEVVQPKLLQSRHGVLWLIERWDEVVDSLTRHAGWTPEAWDRAMDCLGLSSSARLGSGPWDLDPEDSGPAPGLELARRSVEGLRGRLESHLDARDARDRLDAEAGLGGDDAPELRRLERYAADARRQVARCIAELRRLQAEATPARPADAPSPPARPADLPPPRPDRARPAPPNIAASPLPPVDAPAPTAPPASPERPAPLPTGPSAIRSRLAPPSPSPNRRARRARAAAARLG